MAAGKRRSSSGSVVKVFKGNGSTFAKVFRSSSSAARATAGLRKAGYRAAGSMKVGRAGKSSKRAY